MKAVKDLPLLGAGVAVTRAEPPDGPLSRRLAAAGARVLAWQAIEIAPPEDPRPLAAALATLLSWDWLVFSSAHAVEAVAAALDNADRGVLPVAAIGSATAAAARLAGFEVRLVPESPGARGLAAAWKEASIPAGARLLWPASAIARPGLEAALATTGARVDRVTAYRTVDRHIDAERCEAELTGGLVDIVTFTSPSAIASLARVFAPRPLAGLLGGVRIVTLGGTTSAALRESALAPAREALASTLDGLVEAAVAALADSRPVRG